MACAGSLASAQKPAGAQKLPEIKYVKYTLPNGLTVITHEDHRLPLVAVDLWYHVGPLNERPGRTGFAHLFEHMMFEGSEHVGEKAHIKIVQAAGATTVNGTTDFDRTNYFETMPSNQLELALWLESDRMGFLMEGLNRELLINQKDVVRNERRQGEGRPYYVAQEQMFHLLFPKGHPYYGVIIGSHADVESARIADVREFHQQYYTPNNASIAIAGDFDPAKLKALLTKYFGPIPKGPVVAFVTAGDAADHRAAARDGDGHGAVAADACCVADARGLHARILQREQRHICAGRRQGEPAGRGDGLQDPDSAERNLQLGSGEADRHNPVHDNRQAGSEAGRSGGDVLEGAWQSCNRMGRPPTRWPRQRLWT